MLVTRFDPFAEIRELEKRLLGAVEVPAKGEKEAVSAFLPSVNTREDENAYVIEVDVPGVKKEDIKVNVDSEKRTLTISGERKFEKEVKKEDYYKIESSYGKFMRSFSLPENVDAENIEAKTEEGVLRITLPKVKKEEKEVKEIPVK
ncbi:Hsp20/alpha crystallin family protein [Hydrogenimonas urashimensis]|uniref:Hsp20/alpha crystallin family protein n=1 Tax=Hydrogenimonas urashimensis TaxID=2740515 RepID=UPI0019161856|nr:Hsp20/alpha crystallin family protein [Hydrogenimonas urashimensis]